jgi:hypothetical protein
VKNGKLLKHLCKSSKPATIHPMPFVNEKQQDGNPCSDCDGGNAVSKAKTLEILKSLTSRMLLTLTPRKADAPMLVDSGEDIKEVTLLGPQVGQAMFVTRPFEEPVAPKVLINTPAQAASPNSPDFMTSCDGCGYTHKSLNECPRCTTIQKMSRVAIPVWRR